MMKSVSGGSRNDDSPEEPAHIPVLWREILRSLEELPLQDRVVVDCTLGEGGHSELILERFAAVRVIGIERDGAVMKLAEKRLGRFRRRIQFIRDNFSNIARSLEDSGGNIIAFLYDFGISSYHLDRSGRGFSFRGDEPLDMRLDDQIEIDARHIVNTSSQRELADLFFTYGEERWSKRIARYIAEKRVKKSIDTSAELAELILSAIPRRYHVRNIHPATRVFQALRIAVNDELAAIERSLSDAIDILSPGGRVMAISFHSLEDRIVKNIFRRRARGCTCNEPPQHCRCQGRPLVAVLTKKPIVPGADERELNRRARSARLRICEKLIPTG